MKSPLEFWRFLLSAEHYRIAAQRASDAGLRWLTHLGDLSGFARPAHACKAAKFSGLAGAPLWQLGLYGEAMVE
ncbi:hypothetical protein [Mesorhizobium sp. M0323]|uniref:hypothetical protein n=1 Tax=Mesorhizobium sp. M0323 TaxID=2956938 RepID=UPI00333CEC5D